jgi:hypothetical protein
VKFSGIDLPAATMAMNGRDLFAKADQQVSELIARQREAIKQAPTPQQRLKRFSTPCTKAFARSRNAASKSLRGWKRSARPKKA